MKVFSVMMEQHQKKIGPDVDDRELRTHFVDLIFRYFHDHTRSACKGHFKCCQLWNSNKLLI